MSVVRSRQCGYLSATWTSVVLLALCSAALGRPYGDEKESWLCVGPGCADGVDPSYLDVMTRIRRAIDDNDISQDTDTVHWKPGDFNIVSDKLNIYKDGKGDYKVNGEVKLESDHADGDLESTFTIELMPQESENVANEQKIVYSYPYVVFRSIGDGKKVVGDEDAIYKDGTSYVVFGNSDEKSEHHKGGKSANVNSHLANDKTESEDVLGNILHNFIRSLFLTPNEETTPDKRSDLNEASSAMKTALKIAKELFTNMNEMHKNLDSIPRESTNSGMFLDGLFPNYRSSLGGTWNPFGWQSAPEPSADVSNVGGLLASMISDMLGDTVAQKPSRTGSVSLRCPFTHRCRLSAAHKSEGLISPELLWLMLMR